MAQHLDVRGDGTEGCRCWRRLAARRLGVTQVRQRHTGNSRCETPTCPYTLWRTGDRLKPGELEQYHGEVADDAFGGHDRLQPGEPRPHGARRPALLSHGLLDVGRVRRAPWQPARRGSFPWLDGLPRWPRMCRLFGLSAAPDRFRATFWLLEAPTVESLSTVRSSSGRRCRNCTWPIGHWELEIAIRQGLGLAGGRSKACPAMNFSEDPTGLGQSMPSTMRKSRSTPSERAASASW
jgi:hypothetical protein